MKKAQGLPMNVIIIAALALLVLVIIAVIFAGWGKIFSQKTKECVATGGKCVDVCGVGDGADYPTEHPTAKCDDNQKCCIAAS
jgi:hypothetical protein